MKHSRTQVWLRFNGSSCHAQAHLSPSPLSSEVACASLGRARFQVSVREDSRFPTRGRRPSPRAGLLMMNHGSRQRRDATPSPPGFSRRPPLDTGFSPWYSNPTGFALSRLQPGFSMRGFIHPPSCPAAPPHSGAAAFQWEALSMNIKSCLRGFNCNTGSSREDRVQKDFARGITHFVSSPAGA